MSSFSKSFLFLLLLIVLAVDVAAFESESRTFSRDLPDSPSTGDLAHFLALTEPLWPIKDRLPTAEENAALEQFFREITSTSRPNVSRGIQAYLGKFDDSPWNASLRLNLGLLHYRDGLFTDALEVWKLAWDEASGAQHPRARAIADRAVAEYAVLNSKLGRSDKLEEIFAETSGRAFRGSSTEKIAGARIGLATMRTRPEISFLCGPMALDRIYAELDSQRQNRQVILDAQSTARGLSLASVDSLAKEADIPMRIAKRLPGSEIILPAVIHWKSDHFGPLVSKRGDRYLLEDGTFGETLLVTEEAIDREGSGYFLIPADVELPDGWTLVGEDEAETVWGRGYVYGYEPGATTDSDPKIGCGGDGKGMAIWNVYLLAVSLNIVDIPLSYQPPYGPEVALRVNYNQREVSEPSQFTYSNFGHKWTTDWISVIIDDPENTYADVKHSRPEGGMHRFKSSGYPGEYQVHSDTRNRLERLSSDSYKLTYPDGAFDIFDRPDGTVSGERRILQTSRTDPYGNTIQFTYDSNLVLTHITDSLGQETMLHYEDASAPLLITRITDPFGREAKFQYDSEGRLRKIIDPVLIESEFKYDGQGDFIEELTTPYGTTTFKTHEESDELNPYNEPTPMVHDTIRWIEIDDPMGGTERVEYRHDAPGISETETPLPTPRYWGVSNTLNGVIGIRDSETRHWRNTFHWDKQTVSKMGGLENLDYNKAHIYQWLHSDDWARSARILESEKAPLENRVYYNYQDQFDPTVHDGTGLRSKIAQAMDGAGTSQIVQYAYNDRGYVTRFIDPAGRETKYNYAANQIDLVQIQQKVDGTWQTLASFDNYQNHLPGTVVDGGGETTLYTYNTYGQVETITNSLQETTTYIYDHRLDFDPDTDTPSGRGYLVRVEGPVAGAHARLTHDSAGRLKTTIDSEGHTTQFAYDDLNRRTHVHYPDNTYEQWIYDRLDVGAYHDREGRTITYLYNPNRELMVETDAEGNITQYDYCSCGSLGKVIDPNGNTTRWKYDLQGRVTKKIFPDETEFGYEYDPHNGRLRFVTDPLGQIKEYTYHIDNNIDAVSYANTVHSTPSVSYTWHPDFDRLTIMSDDTGTTSYTYHPFDGQTHGAGLVHTVDGPLSNDTIVYTYDELSRLIGRTIGGSGNSLSLKYDALGRVYEKTNNLGTFGYDHVNQTPDVEKITYPNGQTAAFNYWPVLQDRRLGGIEHRDSSQSVISAHGYSYDSDGLILQWQQERSGLTGRALGFAYDDRAQLLSAVITDDQENVLKSFGYGYDRAGNRVSEEIDTGGLRQSGHNQLNQLEQVGSGPVRFSGEITEPGQVWVDEVEARMRNFKEFEAYVDLAPGVHQVEVVAEDVLGQISAKTFSVEIANQGTVTLSYDLNGNLLSRTDASGVTQYEWDAANQLLAIEYDDGSRSEFAYDGHGRRVAIIERDHLGIIESTRRFVWDGYGMAEERDDAGSGVVKRFYTHGVQIVSGDEAPSDYFYTFDHFGSVREVTDAQSALVARYDYDPYGRVEQLSGTFSLDFRFTGHFFHQPSGLHLAPFRAYDADLGRWLSRDPLTMAELLWEGPNLYGYVGNNPINLIDPFGLCGGNWLDNFQMGLDAAGFVPFVGMPADALSGIISLGRGDFVGAGLSAASLLPIGGQAGNAAKMVRHAGAKQGPPIAKVRTSNRPGNKKAVELTYPDGHVKDINPTRVKEWVPNPHPNAPPGARNPVKFPNPLPGSKGKKRPPTQDEVDIWERLR
jgi:RHS repeat-associated protein